MGPHEPSGAAAEPPRIPGYTPVARLGAGSSGSTWLARRRLRWRALKVIPRADLTEIEFAGIHAYRRAAAGTSSLVGVTDVGATPDAYYYALELADAVSGRPGGEYAPRTLRRELDRSGTLGCDEVLDVASELVRGLERLHALDLIHRAVAPHNVLYVGGRPCLSEVGLLARRPGDEPGAGAAAYAPRDGVVDRSGDFYCLGKVVYELVTGYPATLFPELPASGDETLAAHLSGWTRVLDRACSPEPTDRFRSARELRDALARELPAPMPGAPARRRRWRWPRRSAARRT